MLQQLILSPFLAVVRKACSSVDVKSKQPREGQGSVHSPFPAEGIQTSSEAKGKSVRDWIGNTTLAGLKFRPGSGRAWAVNHE